MQQKKLSLALAIALSTMYAGACQAAEAENLDEYTGEDIVVTAERIPTERMNTPANVSVVTAEEIADNHYQTVTEALEQVPGVEMANLGDGTSCVKLNGNERVVVLVDGCRVNND